MVSSKCLAILRRPSTAPALSAILSLPRSGWRERVAGSGNSGEILLGGGEQLLAFARSLGSEGAIAANDQTFARIVRRLDLAHVAIVEQRGLQGSIFGESLERPGHATPPRSASRARRVSRSSWMRAWVIIPRSPTRTSRSSLNRCLSLATCAASVLGSPTLPSNTSTATGSHGRRTTARRRSAACPVCRLGYSRSAPADNSGLRDSSGVRS